MLAGTDILRFHFTRRNTLCRLPQVSTKSIVTAAFRDGHIGPGCRPSSTPPIESGGESGCARPIAIGPERPHSSLDRVGSARRQICVTVNYLKLSEGFYEISGEGTRRQVRNGKMDN